MTFSVLPLKLNDKTYLIPSPPARIGLALQASYVIAQARRAQIDPPAYAVERASIYDDLSRSLDEDALGPVWQQMIDDDVTIEDLRRAARAAYTWIVTGSQTAARVIMDPEGATDVGEVADGPKVSTTTDEAPTIPQPDSTSGTTSPPQS